MALFYGQNIKCKYITVMLYITMSCCIHQCYVCMYQCHVVYINVCLYIAISEELVCSLTADKLCRVLLGNKFVPTTYYKPHINIFFSLYSQPISKFNTPFES